jgi:hypothetical protein
MHNLIWGYAPDFQRYWDAFIPCPWPKAKRIDQAHGDPAKPDVGVGLQGQLQWASDFHSTRLSIKTHICC